MVTVYGSKTIGEWWDDSDGAMFIGNELRRCRFVGLYLKWDAPVPGAGGCIVDQGKHVITAWGDEGESGELLDNPSTVWVTDSDRSNPSDPPYPGRENYAYAWDDINDRWYIDYFEEPELEDPYLWNIVTLSPPDEECDGHGLTAVGSYLVKQDDFPSANDLHYKAAAYDSWRICTYSTDLDWNTSDVPRIVKYHVGFEQGCLTPECEYIEVEWEFGSGEEVPQGTEVTITTEFLLPNANVISYRDVYFTDNGVPGVTKPSFGWSMDTPTVSMPTGGGFVVGGFELYSDPAGADLVGGYRFQHEYGSDQHADYHTFRLDSLEPATTYYVGDLRFGESDTLLDAQDLWAFVDWIQRDPAVQALPAGGLIEVTLNWCPGDVNGDGFRNVSDFTRFAAAFGSHVGDPNYNAVADLNGDGFINVSDFTQFAASYGTPCS